MPTPPQLRASLPADRRGCRAAVPEEPSPWPRSRSSPGSLSELRNPPAVPAPSERRRDSLAPSPGYTGPWQPRPGGAGSAGGGSARIRPCCAQSPPLQQRLAAGPSPARVNRCPAEGTGGSRTPEVQQVRRCKRDGRCGLAPPAAREQRLLLDSRSAPASVLETQSLKHLAPSASTSVGPRHCKSPNLCNRKTSIQLCRALLL